MENFPHFLKKIAWEYDMTLPLTVSQQDCVLFKDTTLCIHMMTSSNGNFFRVTGPLCGEFTCPGEFPTQRPVTQSFDVFSDLQLNKRLSKQPWGWWFETPSLSLWRHCNEFASSLSYRRLFHCGQLIVGLWRHNRQWSDSILAPVIVCGLKAPRHYLTQCWLIITNVLWHLSKDTFIRKNLKKPINKIILYIYNRILQGRMS